VTAATTYGEWYQCRGQYTQLPNSPGEIFIKLYTIILNGGVT